jgi:uncharacterized membrane protein YphA (DoxX/SURF4 family)
MIVGSLLNRCEENHRQSVRNIIGHGIIWYPCSLSSFQKGPNSVHPALLAAIRLAVAAVWIYEGLWLKVVRPSPHELAVVASVAVGPLSPSRLLFLIGWGEALLGVGVLSGLYSRFLAWFQGVLLVLMNGAGIAFAGGTIADPLGLVIHNLPFLLCMVILGVYGPGSFAPGRVGGKS